MPVLCAITLHNHLLQRPFLQSFVIVLSLVSFGFFVNFRLLPCLFLLLLAGSVGTVRSSALGLLLYLYSLPPQLHSALITVSVRETVWFLSVVLMAFPKSIAIIPPAFDMHFYLNVPPTSQVPQV